MIILDTNVLSEVMRKEPKPAVVSWMNAQPTPDLFLTTITIAEISYGIEVLTPGRRRRDLETAFRRIIEDAFQGRVLDFDRSSAEQYGKLMSHRKRLGRAMSALDGQIAAIGNRHGFSVATRNIKGFEECGVQLVDPFV